MVREDSQRRKDRRNSQDQAEAGTSLQVLHILHFGRE
nr:MAG TPA: hypothetical protein [Caudoviricetes sp.]